MNFDAYYEDPAARGDVPEWTQLRSACHTARKAHTCEDCGQPIEPGQRYSELVGVYDGQFITAKSHFGGCPGWEESWDEEHEADRFCWNGRDAA